MNRETAEHYTILRGLVGSTVHGLNVNDGIEDRDEMGICVEPLEGRDGAVGAVRAVHLSFCGRTRGARRRAKHRRRSRSDDLQPAEVDAPGPARQAFGYTYPNYDFPALAAAVCTADGWQLEQARFYTGIPDASDDPFWNYFWAGKLRTLSRQGVQVFSRSLRYRNIVVRLPDGSTHAFLTAEEKGIDVRIAIDVIRLAHGNAYDVAILFNQDQDLSELCSEILLHPTRSVLCGNNFRIGLEVIDDRVGVFMRDVELLDQLLAEFGHDWVRKNHRNQSRLRRYQTAIRRSLPEVTGQQNVRVENDLRGQGRYSCRMSSTSRSRSSSDSRVQSRPRCLASAMICG